MNSTCALVAVCALLAGCSRSGSEPATEAKSAPGLVEMGPEAQKHMGLEVAPAGLSELTEYLRVTGTVQPVNTRVSHVRPLARGRLQEVLVEIGDRVQDGQPLARFDNIEAGELLAQLASARADLEKLKIQLAAQTRQAERDRRLADLGAAPRKDYELSRAEQQALEETIRSQQSVIGGIAARLERFELTGEPPLTTIRAPFAGVVTMVRAAPGEVVSPDSEMFTVADLTRVWVQAEVYEKDLGRVRVGQAAVIEVDTYPGERFAGQVTYISDLLDPQTRTAKVRCEVTNRDLRLKLDMFATVRLPTSFRRQALAVPAGAIQQHEGKQIVFVRRTPTGFEARPVSTGKLVNGRLEITAGLRAGEPIVVAGAFHLKSILAGKELGEEH
ncbi:MAG: efflux RND transporter periplasmic adaptor subunit [Acidobacteriota bacterium]